MGFPIPIATSVRGVHTRRASYPRLRSAHGVSHALDGFLLRKPCGLVSSHSHVRDSLSRGFPRRPAALPRRQVVPSCRWRCSSTTELPRQRQVPSPHLQGFDPSSDPLQTTECLALPVPDPLLSFCSFGLSSEYLGDAFTPPPLVTLPPDPTSDPGRRPSAYRSAPSLTLYPQSAFPSELRDLPCSPPKRRIQRGPADTQKSMLPGISRKRNVRSKS